MSEKTSYQSLRTQYPVFSYLNFSYDLDDFDVFTCCFTYQIDGLATFTHRVNFAGVSPNALTRQPTGLLDRLVFHLGLIEMFSYWKLTCSPRLEIVAGSLNTDQLNFWHELLINGMGEYFYLNKIDFRARDFVTLHAATHTTPPIPFIATKNHHHRRSLVNLGGGKDSAVMLTIMQDAREAFANFIVAPHSIAATWQAQKTDQPFFRAARSFDSQLLTLNQQGFLNGHVPFSASLAFINLLAAVLYDYDFCLTGNESSADEPTLIWENHPVNHQYSKSTKFEQSFQTYCSQYLLENVTYCSFLRIFNELQIAHIFCTNPTFFPITRSCNRGQKHGIWCHHCAKCLFVFLQLAAFLDYDILTTQIFNHDLLADQTLLPTLRELLGLAPTKPFECVGTRDDALAAFYLLYTKCEQSRRTLPPLVAALRDEVLSLRADWPVFVHNLSTLSADPAVTPHWVAELTRTFYERI